MGTPTERADRRGDCCADAVAAASSDPPWHVYLLECAGGTLYTGIALDVERRFKAHQAGKGGRYTRAHPPLRIVASAAVGTKSEALRVEIAIKRLPPAGKPAAVRLLARTSER